MEELSFNLDAGEDDGKAKARVKKATKAKKEAKQEPTWDEKWREVYSKKNTDTDLDKLRQVKAAVEAGEIGLENQSLRKFSKAQALRIYQTLVQNRKEQYLVNLVKNKPDNYELIDSEQKLDRLVRDLANEPIYAFDTETTGLNVYRDVIVGTSFTLPKNDYHVYIPVAHDVGKQIKREVMLEALRPTLTNPDQGKVLHNARFDSHMLIRHGLRMQGIKGDTRIMMALLNENEMSYRLKDLATKYGKYFGFEDYSLTYEQLFGKVGFNVVPVDVGMVYACKDTHLTWQFYDWMMGHFNRLPELLRLYEKIENPLIEVVIDMEQTGFLIDEKFAAEYGVELKQDIEKLQIELTSHFGEINLNSPVQLSKVLYDDLELTDYSKKRSTDAKTLKQLRGEHEGVDALLSFRELTKLHGTYIEALPEQIQPDGRVHGSFNQVETVTGRFSSNAPNLQNLPQKARKMFVAPDGLLLMGIDFSQIEPRVLSHMSGDLNLREPYLKGQDLYATLASRVFKVPIEQCGDGSKYRKMMKTGLLAVMYGTSMWTLAKQLGITVEEAYKFILDFFATYPDVDQWIRSVWEEAKENEFVTTMFDRKRRFPNHKQEARMYDSLSREICSITGTVDVPYNFWEYKNIPYPLKRQFQYVKGSVERVRRMAVNVRIQGSSADILKMSMLDTHGYILRHDWRTLATIHDEIMFLVPKTIELGQVEEIESLMKGVVTLDVPLKVDTELGTRWGEGVKKAEWFQKIA